MQTQCVDKATLSIDRYEFTFSLRLSAERSLRLSMAVEHSRRDHGSKWSFRDIFLDGTNEISSDCLGKVLPQYLCADVTRQDNWNLAKGQRDEVMAWLQKFFANELNIEFAPEY